jgi:LmbE family N-acetylglucosaminyl deacetylase
MKWVYLSPHLDDAAFSCGGLAWEQVQAGQSVEIWTICAGDPPEGPLPAFAQELHARWKTGPEASTARRAEDLAACAQLGVSARHFAWPDCIYRRLPGSGKPLIHERDELFQPLNPAEAGLIEEVANRLARELPARARLVSPLAMGGHVDHRLARAAAEHLSRPLWYYADFPYVVGDNLKLEQWLGEDWRPLRRAISAAGLSAWQAAVAAHASQMSSFWASPAEMRSAIQQYALHLAGSSIWRAGP